MFSLGDVLVELCATGAYALTSGMEAVEGDFASAAAQTLEHIAYDEEFLGAVLRGKGADGGVSTTPPPRSLVRALASRRAGTVGLANLRQVAYSTVDYLLHHRKGTCRGVVVGALGARCCARGGRGLVCSTIPNLGCLALPSKQKKNH